MILLSLWILVALVAGAAVLAGRARVFSSMPRTGDVTSDRDPFTQGPWVGIEGAVLVDRRILVAVAEPEELRLATSHRDRIRLLERQIKADGLRVPVRINLDQRGQLCVADGHHRLAVATRMGAERVPVVLVGVEQIRGWSRPAAPFFISALVTCS